MDGGTWWATVHGVTKSRTRLSEFLTYFTNCSGHFSVLILLDLLAFFSWLQYTQSPGFPPASPAAPLTPLQATPQPP